MKTRLWASVCAAALLALCLGACATPSSPVPSYPTATTTTTAGVTQTTTTFAPTTTTETPTTTTVAPTTTTTGTPTTTRPPLPPGEGVAVTYTPQVVRAGSTFTGRAPLEAITYIVADPLNERGLSTARSPFSYGIAKDGKPHWITQNNQKLFDELQSGALAWDNKSTEKVLYLTFDCGYEYGTLTSDILDVLAEKDVPAAFFCTLGYLREAPEVVARMLAEGHVVGNHSTTHPDCTTVTREKLAWELLGVENYLRVNFGYSSRYFRFPTGAYSPDALELVNSVGYQSVFWSVAHADWDPNNQPGVEVSYQTVTSRLHPGAVILLHSTSPDNAAILGRVIDYAREQGYTFRSLDEYAHWNL